MNISPASVSCLIPRAYSDMRKGVRGVPAAQWGYSPEVSGANQEAADCKMPMGWTSENVAGDFNISREKMDAFAARSHQRAAAAQASGRFDAEIFPITVPVSLDGGKGGEKTYATVSKDDGIRANSTPEGLAKIKPAFPQWAPAQTTGGNASQLTDGAAGILLMRRSMAQKLGKPILAKYVATAVSGLAPRIMGIGPSLAIPRVLELTGITKEQVEIFEINEAFASMAVYCEEKLEIDPEKLNVNGGACALGHPLGAVSLPFLWQPLSIELRASIPILSLLFRPALALWSLL